MTEPNDVEEAVEILEEGSREEQKEALRTLKGISETQPDELVSYLDIICSFANDDDIEVRRDVGSILSNVAIHDSGAVAPYAATVSTLLTDDDRHVLASVMTVAAQIVRESPTALSGTVDRLFELLNHEIAWASGPASITRAMAASTLGDLGNADPAIAARADEPLADRLDDEKPIVRRATVTALRTLGLAHPSAVSTALARLPTRLDDSDAEVRRNAIMAYVLFRHQQPDAITQPDAVAPALRQAAEHTDLNNIDESGLIDENKILETHQYVEEMAAEEG
jgi:HEAT repeat protein